MTAPSGLCSPLIDVISSLTIVNPPLALRVEDIPLIATAMLDTRHAAGEGPAERINRAALDALVIYPWPHNYKELEDAIRTFDPNRYGKRDCLRASASGDSFVPARFHLNACQTLQKFPLMMQFSGMNCDSSTKLSSRPTATVQKPHGDSVSAEHA